MHDPVRPMLRPGRAAAGPSSEVARARSLYLRELRARIQDGTYFTPGRVDTAMKRLFQAVEDDLPQDPVD
jgi:hypothetical protein